MDDRHAGQRRAPKTKVTLRASCDTQYSALVHERTRPIVLDSGRRPTVECPDCGREVYAAAMRQVTRGDNPRARVCTKCAVA